MALIAAACVVTLRFGGLPRWLAILGLAMLVLPFVAGAGLGAMLGPGVGLARIGRPDRDELPQAGPIGAYGAAGRPR